MVAAPVALVSLGLYTKDRHAIISRYDVYDWRDKHFANFSNHTDDVMQYAPIILVYGLGLLKVKSKNDLVNRSLLLVKTELLGNGIAQILKYTTHIKRPDGKGDHSFPSGHTTQAFMAATFMHKELGGKSVWYSIGAYTMATSVGVMRVMNNRHWSSDVLVGAGIGILSTNIVYATHRYRWGKKPVVLVPTFNGGPGLFFTARI